MIGKQKKFDFKWLIAPAIVVVWMITMYWIKGIYPFGDSTLVSFDLRTGNMPVIYYVYDIFRSGDFTKLIYDFHTAAGFARDSLLTIIQPRFVFCMFFPREHIINAIDLFFVFEFGLIAFTASYSFSKLFNKLPFAYNILMSVMYAFNGFNLMYLTNIDWLDIVMLYPLLMLFAVNLLNGKSKVPFFLVLAYLMTVYTYMAFFIVVSLIIFGGLYIYIILDKESRKKAVVNLGVGTGAALVASSYSVYTYAVGIMSSERFDMGTYVRDSYSGAVETVPGFFGILKAPAEIDIISVFMFLGTALAIASLIVMWVRFKNYKQSRKHTIFFTIVILLFLCQVVFKSTMLYWHMGSYQFFPFRNGYMVSFFCCCIIGYYFTYYGNLEGIKTDKNVLKFITIIPTFLCALVVASYIDVFTFNLDAIFSVLNISVAYQTNGMAYPYLCLAAAVVVCFLLIKLISYKTLRNILTFALVFIMIGINSVFFISNGMGKNKYDMYKKELEVSDMVKHNDELSRTCNIDACLGINYSYIADVHSISNWTHLLSANQLKSLENFGFCSNFTNIRDMGGTVFSRALFRFTETISGCELDNRLYVENVKTESGVRYYSNKYVLPAVVCSNDQIDDINIDDYKNLFEYQNAVYSAMGGEGRLFNEVECKSVSNNVKYEEYFYNKEDENTGEMGLFSDKKGIVTSKFIFDVSEESVLYFDNAIKDSDIMFIGIYVNNKPFHVYDGKIVKNSKSYNTAYLTGYNSGILELGVFENETVEISIIFNEDHKTDEAAVMYLMDTGKLRTLCENQPNADYSINKSQITLNVDNKNNSEFVFVPLSYDDNWLCTVNGENVEPICVLGNFMGIKINEGENVISLNYSRTDAYIKIVVLIVSFLIGLALVIFERRINFPRGIQTLAFVVFSLIFTAGVTILYILPIGYNAITALMSLFK